MTSGIDYTPELAHEMTELVLSRLPMPFPDADPTARGGSDWNVTAVAMLARASTAVRSLFRLGPTDSWIVAEAAARTLIEQVITFAWLASDPDTHVPLWLAGDDEERRKADSKHTNWLVQSKYLKEAAPLLDDDLREVVTAEAGALLDLAGRALKADKVWRPRIEILRAKGCSFAEIYATAYVHYSWSTHALLRPLYRYIGTDEADVVHVGFEGNDDSSTPWGIGLLVYGLGLLVAYEALGWPDSKEVDRLLAASS